MSTIASEIPSKSRSKVMGRDLTTFAIGGELSFLIEPDSVDELSSTIKILAREQLPYRVLGAGSNLIIPDSGVDSIVIRLGKGFRTFDVRAESESRVSLTVGGCMPLMTLSRNCSDEGLAGLEFAGGIPASAGGAAWMNAGAHGSEMADIISALTYVNSYGEIVRELRRDIPYSYRHSGLPQGCIVCGLEIELSKANPEEVSARRAEFLAERKLRQPLSSPSAGSVFRNPSKELTAGAVLERAGCKGMRIGGALVSELHANWIINPDREATAQDVRELIAKCQMMTKAEGNLELLPEIAIW